jgi:predicted transcriptional regulator
MPTDMMEHKQYTEYESRERAAKILALAESGVSYKDLATQFGVTRSRIAQLVQKARIHRENGARIYDRH